MLEILEGAISAGITQYHAFRACGEPVGTWLEGGHLHIWTVSDKYVSICQYHAMADGVVVS